MLLLILAILAFDPAAWVVSSNIKTGWNWHCLASDNKSCPCPPKGYNNNYLELSSKYPGEINLTSKYKDVFTFTNLHCCMSEFKPQKAILIIHINGMVDITLDCENNLRLPINITTMDGFVRLQYIVESLKDEKTYLSCF